MSYPVTDEPPFDPFDPYDAAIPYDEYAPEEDPFAADHFATTTHTAPAASDVHRRDHAALPLDDEPHRVPATLTDGLNPEQTEAVRSLRGPLLVVAGPGSGKTRVLTHRIAALLATGTRPWEVLAVTFTNKAAAEMRERVGGLVGEDDARKMWVATFHAACARILRLNYTEAGLPRQFTIVDTDDAKRILRGVLDDLGLPNDAQEVREAASHISRVKNAAAGPEMLENDPDKSIQGYGAVMRLYQERLTESGAVDFDDLLLRVLDLLATNKDVRSQLQRRFSHILIDEFQDTNEVQYRIVKILARHAKSICVVGDFDQCHPAGTKVLTTAGEVSIEDLVPGEHKLISWAPRDAKGPDEALRGFPSSARPSGFGYDWTRGVRNFAGNLVRVSAGDRFVDMTPNHRVPFRWSREAIRQGDATAVYLMRRGEWWRVGTCKLYRGEDFFGLGTRARQEKADAAWILTVLPNAAAATVLEDVLSANFGLPQATFEPAVTKYANQKGKRTAEEIAEVFGAVKGMPQKARKLLAKFGREVAHPLWAKEGGRFTGGSLHYAGRTEAANLVSGYMEMVTRDGASKGTRWERISVMRVTHNGPVYSLDVRPYHNYVAQGIVVDNCVYGFRGASPENMATFDKDFPGTKVVRLAQNYRSTKSIVEVSRAVIAPNPAFHRASLRTENPQGDPAILYTAMDDRDEAQWIVSQIAGRVSRGSRLDENAVLMRTNAQTRSLEEQLVRSRLAYDVVGALKFYERAEVKTALSYVRTAVNVQDIVAFSRAINSPKRGVGEASVAKFIAEARNSGKAPLTWLAGAIGNGLVKGAAGKGATAFLDIVAKVAVAADQGPAAAVRAAVDESQLRPALLALKDGSGPDRVENVEELINAAVTFETSDDSVDTAGQLVADLPGLERTLAFLENVALVASTDTGDGEDTGAGKVQLMTVHASKGKEFDHVVVAGVEEDLFPHARSVDEPAGIEEERRLLFVAVSRARKTLALTRCERRMLFGRVIENKGSRFLADLPDSVRRLPERASRSTTFGSRPSSQPRTFGGARSGYTAGARGGSKPAWTPGGTTRRPAAASKPAGPRLPLDRAKAGAHVQHAVYGNGIIRDINGTTVVVEFPSGKRVLDATVAPLTLLS